MLGYMRERTVQEASSPLHEFRGRSGLWAGHGMRRTDNWWAIRVTKGLPKVGPEVEADLMEG